MVLDRLENAGRYAPLHPGLAKALDHLEGIDVHALPLGEHEIDGRRLYMSVSEDQGRGREGARLEAHRKYIDIQVAVTGHEVVGWKNVNECTDADGAFDEERDVVLFSDEPDAWIGVRPGSFVILFPEDAHAPLAGEGTLHKVVVKVQVEW
jgi:biofilm protein TabA